MNIFYFELKKFTTNPKNRICLLILSLILFGLFFLNQSLFAQKSSEADLAMIRSNLSQTQLAVESLKKDLVINESDGKLLEQLKEAEEDQELLTKQVSALEAGDSEQYVNLQDQLDRKNLSLISSKDSQEYRYLASNINYREAIKKVGGTASPVINDSQEAAFTTGRLMMAWLSSTAILVLATVLVTDTLSGEIESSQIRFYQLLGGRKTKDLLIKLLVPILVTFTVVCLDFLIIYVASGITNDFGTWKYPYLLADGTIFPIWKIALNTLFVFIFALIFLASLGQLLSLLFKKSLLVVGLIVVFLTAFMTFEGEAWFQPFKKFLPIEYLSYGQIFRDLDFLPQNPLLVASLYLGGLSLIFVALTAYLYKNYYYRRLR
ncbi:ABC transporter permease [Streptococcaceae bacterium ESL0687]|nr:ABC transporter permease [Streptococcaceae bacterium ESL0687]